MLKSTGLLAGSLIIVQGLLIFESAGLLYTQANFSFGSGVDPTGVLLQYRRKPRFAAMVIVQVILFGVSITIGANKLAVSILPITVPSTMFLF